MPVEADSTGHANSKLTWFFSAKLGVLPCVSGYNFCDNFSKRLLFRTEIDFSDKNRKTVSVRR